MLTTNIFNHHITYNFVALKKTENLSPFFKSDIHMNFWLLQNRNAVMDLLSFQSI